MADLWITHVAPETPPPKVRLLTVADRERIADSVIQLRLVDPDGERLPAWMPGAHVDLTGPTGITRQYSLCGEIDQPREWKVAVLLEPNGRGGSTAIHQSLREGDRVTIQGPRNDFRLTDSPRFLFIAGGIGIAPIVPMVGLLNDQNEFVNKRPWRLVYTGRERSTMAFADQLEALGPQVELHMSSTAGRLDLATLVEEIKESTAVFCCGPESLIEEARARSIENRLLAFYAERFTPAMDLKTAASGAAFEVKLARSGRVVDVKNGQTILDSLEEAGIAAPCSCREGVCGTCETQVLAGVPDHRDSVLEDAERDRNETMMICVSRARTNSLVLDL